MDNDWGKVVAAISRNPFVVGAVGAVLALRSVPGTDRWEKCINVLGGSVCAGYGTPFLAEWMGWTSLNITAFASLIIGLSSMTLVAEFLLAIRAVKWADIITGWIEIFTGWLSRFAQKNKE